MRVTRAFVALSLLATLWPAIATAQADKAGVVTTLEGHVTAARTATPQPVALKFKDDVFVNDRVVTGDRSLARLLLGGRAVVTVRNQPLTLPPNPSAPATGIGLNSGPIPPQMRASALAGLSPTGTHPVEGGNTAAKNAAMGATVATFTSGTLPITSLVLPAAPPPPSIPTPFPGTNKGSTTTALTPTVSSIPSVCFPPSCIPVQTPR